MLNSVTEETQAVAGEDSSIASCEVRRFRHPLRAESSPPSPQIWTNTQPISTYQVQVSIKVRGVLVPEIHESPTSKLLTPVPNNLKLSLVLPDHKDEHEFVTRSLGLRWSGTPDAPLLRVFAGDGPLWTAGSRVYAELQIGAVVMKSEVALIHELM